MAQTSKAVTGYLPDEVPTVGKTLIFAFQQLLVMFPATVTVALLTGFHVSTTIFASGLATISFLLITRGKIPLYYGSSFSYIAAICSITMAKFGVVAPDSLISQAQFGIIMSGPGFYCRRPYREPLRDGYYREGSTGNGNRIHRDGHRYFTCGNRNHLCFRI